MNKRIKELYEQAHIERQQEYFSSVVDPTIKSVSVTRQFDPELFAELIIKESIQLALDEKQRYANISHRDMIECVVAMDNYQMLVKEHFGIEE
jgi:hypothetical protein